jgi:excisionase family DNA binding protein
LSTAAKNGIRRTHQAPETPAHPVLLTADDTADLLRTSRTAIYAMVARSQVPGVIRIGRRVLFRRADVMQWLDELSKKPR